MHVMLNHGHSLNIKYLFTFSEHIPKLDWRTRLNKVSKDNNFISISIYFCVQAMGTALSWLQEALPLSTESAPQSYLQRMNFIPKTKVALPGIVGLLPFLPYAKAGGHVTIRSPPVCMPTRPWSQPRDTMNTVLVREEKHTFDYLSSS